jgi:organic hydroperoxide reductase OsmC/OhrA
VLRPRIILRGAVDAAKVARLVRIAHQECFIANSLSARIRVEHEIVGADVGDAP